MIQEPVDALHRQCIRERDEIRRLFELARYHTSIWRPAPCPPRGEYR